jgi:hypothetical protein
MINTTYSANYHAMTSWYIANGRQVTIMYLPPLDGVLTGLTLGGSGFSFSGLSLLSDFPGKKNNGIVK